MSKGFLWFCQNNSETDYVKLSIELARSIKQHNRENNICVIVDQNTKLDSGDIDKILILSKDDCEDQAQKFANEYKAFRLSPFTHTIKLEADMLFTSNTDWWWNHLCQHDLVFSINCFNYKDEIIQETPYRKLFRENYLPNVYNGLTYFRRSQRAMKFFELCKDITENWQYVRDNLLKNCHDPYPSTDVIYALAQRIADPLGQELIDYPWFKFIHSKPAINRTNHVVDQYNYLYPVKLEDRVYLGGRRLDRIWHYYKKNTIDILHERTF